MKNYMFATILNSFVRACDVDTIRQIKLADIDELVLLQ